MNNARRARISSIISVLEQAQADIQEVLGDEVDAYENMPDGLKNSETGELSQNAISALESAELQEAIDQLEEARG